MAALSLGVSLVVRGFKPSPVTADTAADAKPLERSANPARGHEPALGQITRR
jgi:hypothetical protein